MLLASALTELSTDQLGLLADRNRRLGIYEVVIKSSQVNSLTSSALP